MKQDAIKRKLKGNKSRLSLPKVNPDPQPPGAETSSVNNAPSNTALTPSPTANAASNTQTPTSPLSGNSLSAYQPIPGQPDPRDSQYWRDVTVLMQNRNAGLRDTQLSRTYQSGVYQDAISNLTRQKPKDIRNYKEGANRAGAFYSSKTGEGVGEIEQDYYQRQTGLNRDYQTMSSQLANQEADLTSSFGSSEQQALADAIARLSGNEMDRPVDSDTSSLEELLSNLGGGGNGGKGNKKKNKNKKHGNKN